MSQSKRIIRRPDVETRLGMKHSALYDRLNPNSPVYDPDFPKPISLGGNLVGWIEGEVDAYIDKRVAARDANMGAAA